MHARKPWRIVAASITSLIILGLFAALVILQPPQRFVDQGTGGSAAAVRKVRQNLIESFCPPRMALADDAQYGDSEFQTTVGDLSGSARYAAFGTVYDAGVEPLESTGGAQTDDKTGSVTLEAPDDDVATSDDVAMIASGEDADKAGMLRSSLLKAQDGSGQAGAMASKATTGDLRGISSSGCVTPQLEQSFLLTGTAQGMSQQLVLANPSSKSTSVTIEARGTSQEGRLALSTDSTVTMRAGSLAFVNLSAAFPDQEGLLVNVTSEQTPVAAVVRTIVSSGLTPKGNDMAMPLHQTAESAEISSIEEGDAVRLLVHAAQESTSSWSWITQNGLVSIGEKTLQADRVSSFDLGQAPQGALGLVGSSDVPMSVSAVLTRDGENGQSDFALANAVPSSASSAVALPAGFEAVLTLSNTTNRKAKATVALFDGHGTLKERKTIDLAANSAKRLDVDAAAVRVDDESQSVSWNARLSHHDLDQAKVAGLSVLEPSELTPRNQTVWVTSGQQVVG